jgi:hypothetical protein
MKTLSLYQHEVVQTITKQKTTHVFEVGFSYSIAYAKKKNQKL